MSLPLLHFLRMQVLMNASIADGIRLFSIALLSLLIGMRSMWRSTSRETSHSSSMLRICGSLKGFWPSVQVEQANCSISRSLREMWAFLIPPRADGFQYSSSATFRPEMANTLIKWATIAEPIAQRILIYDGDEKFQFKGIEVVPWRIVG